jgi:hypothetical protein
MSLNISNLTAYVDEQRMALIRKMVLGGRSINFFTVQPDIKSVRQSTLYHLTLWHKPEHVDLPMLEQLT